MNPLKFARFTRSHYPCGSLLYAFWDRVIGHMLGMAEYYDASMTESVYAAAATEFIGFTPVCPECESVKAAA